MTDFDFRTEAEAEASGREFGRALIEAIELRIDKHFAALEKRFAELEQRAGMAMRFTGIFSRAGDYTRGSVCVYGGTLWFCVRDNRGITPGTTDDWMLILKHAGGAAQVAPRLKEVK